MWQPSSNDLHCCQRHCPDACSAARGAVCAVRERGERALESWRHAAGPRRGRGRAAWARSVRGAGRSQSRASYIVSCAGASPANSLHGVHALTATLGSPLAASRVARRPSARRVFGYRIKKPVLSFN